ncbi:MAG: Gfo/Idh/MocA family oxidoreductase, partial [Planctomycetales bacterium]|nr:Gfo/Idh/MocA family oxidoreductase [Planctomycetales bacterium]
ATSDQQLMVGFNRRFSPHAAKMKQLLQGRTGPLCMNMMVNAGSIPSDHWVHDPESGGGRMIGEGCHWIDLMMFLTGAPITKCQAATIGDVPGVTTRNDHAAAVFTFADGSLGTLHYFANGNRAYPKEKLTVFADGKVLELDNFRLLQGFGWSNFKKFKTMRQDKGHQAECLQFVQRIADGGEALIPFDSLWNVTHFSFQADPIAWKRVAADEQTTTLVC